LSDDEEPSDQEEEADELMEIEIIEENPLGNLQQEQPPPTFTYKMREYQFLKTVRTLKGLDNIRFKVIQKN
jgi:hypothetical protein